MPASAYRAAQDHRTLQPVQAVEIASATPEYQPQGPVFAEMVVEAAVDEALARRRFPTAWALRTLYDQEAGDPAFVLMTEKVFSQTADGKTFSNFVHIPTTSITAPRNIDDTKSLTRYVFLPRYKPVNSSAAIVKKKSGIARIV